MAGSSTGNTNQASKCLQQAFLASLSVGLQQTLPQLTSLTEAALRSASVDGVESQHKIMKHGSEVARERVSPGMFVAASLQPGSPALKPLSGLVFTLLKLSTTTILTKPEPDVEAARLAVGCLCAALTLNSMVLQAAHASSSNCSKSDALFAMLLRTNDAAWGAGRLSIIHGSMASTASSNSDAIAYVPWLVSLGRCCMGHALLLQQSQAGASAVWGSAAQSSQQHIGDMARALQQVAAVLPVWLQSGTVSAQLAPPAGSGLHHTACDRAAAVTACSGGGAGRAAGRTSLSCTS